jgi:hypothetical protein
VPPRYKSIVDELSHLIAHCEYFRQYDSAPSDLPSTDFKRVVRDLDASTAMPLVQFIALEAGLSETQQNECFQIIESYLIRRAIVGAENKEYNKLFPEVVGALSGSAPDEIRSKLERKFLSGGGTTRSWPSDPVLTDAVSTRNLYNGMRLSALRLLLERLEINLRGKKTETKSIGDGLTIEHALPESWSEHWPLNGKTIPANAVKYQSLLKEELEPLADAVRARNAALQTLGNLTLLNRWANPAASNFAFPKKKSEYSNSVLLLNRYFDPIQDWNEERIALRSKSLAEAICKIWPRPKGGRKRRYRIALVGCHGLRSAAKNTKPAAISGQRV